MTRMTDHLSSVDLSADLGEARTPEERSVEDRIWTMVTSANVACGGHAGDRDSMADAVETAARLGVVLGAHPSYPDREGFGRRSMVMSPQARVDAVAGQLWALAQTAMQAGLPLRRVKAHGALYHDAARDPQIAEDVVHAIGALGSDVALVCSRDSAMWRAAERAGIPRLAEAFGDRRYRRDGSLVPRDRTDALLLDVDEAVEQARRIVLRSEVMADDGATISIVADTLCIHSDMPRSVERLRAIRDALGRDGIRFVARDA